MAASGLGDELHLECESQAVRTTTLNQNNKPVQIQTAIFSFPGEPPRTTEKSKVRNWATRSRVADLAGCSNTKV